MKIDFDKCFRNNHDPELAMPAKVLDYLSKDLPQGTKYQMDKDGNVIIGGKDVRISGFTVNLDERMKRVLGKNPKAEDIINYSYNTQRTITFSLIKPGYIIINGKEMPVEKFSWNVYDKLDFSNGHMIAKPYPFPEPKQVTYSTKDGEYSISLKTWRIPNESVYVESYITEDDKPLQLEYCVDPAFDTHKPNPKNNKITFRLRLKNAKSTSEMLNALMVAYDLSNKNSFINPMLIAACQKLLEIEKYLGIKFSPIKMDFNNENLTTMETVYNALVRRMPVRLNKYINSMDYTELKEEVVKELKDNNSNFAFLYADKKQFVLFGEEINLIALYAVYNINIGSIDQLNNGQFRVSFNSASGNKKSFTGILLFKDEKDYSEYDEITDNSTKLKFLSSAKSIEEYVSESNSNI